MSSEIQKVPRVLIVGGGFAGIECASRLAKAPVEITLADRHNYHLFQPLLYQVATAALPPADIAAPIRHLLRNQKNIQVLMDELIGVDLQKKLANFQGQNEVSYDYLVLATGATHSYFGREDWASTAPGLKTIDDALEIRRRVLLAYEAAEWEPDTTARQAALTFVVIGGGPTGVEMAGALKEIAAKTLPNNFRHIDTTTAKVVLVQAGSRLLEAMPEKMGLRAQRDLEKMGVHVRLNCRVTEIKDGLVSIGNEEMPAKNVIWAAGVRGSEVAATLTCELDPQGRVLVLSDLSIPAHPEAFVIGDLTHLNDPQTGNPVPGVAPAAVQMGKHVARLIIKDLGGKQQTPREAFNYHDKGSMATIGRDRAVASIGGHQFGGFVAWLVWGVVHIIPLVGFRNKMSVLFSWLWNYCSLAKNARIIFGIKKKTPEAIKAQDKGK